MDISYRYDIDAPDGWAVQYPSRSTALLQPANPDTFAADGLVPSVLVMAGPKADVTPVGTVLEQVDRVHGDVSFRSSLGVGADDTVAFFQIVSTTESGGHQLVVTATACHHQVELVAGAFDALCAGPIDFEVTEDVQ